MYPQLYSFYKSWTLIVLIFKRSEGVIITISIRGKYIWKPVLRTIVITNGGRQATFIARSINGRDTVASGQGG